ncbi:hypothetical protein HJC10_34000 [Corallococcus exiguus]|nr:hypothetical protein [Corallococcus exiguus]
MSSSASAASGVGSPASVTSAESSGSATSARSRATARFWASRSADCSGADRRERAHRSMSHDRPACRVSSSAMRTMASRTSASRACSAWWWATSAP